jgi:putative transposase
MTYWRLHYHLIWSTQDRRPSITPEIEKIFYGVIYSKAKDLDVKIHAAGSVEDHTHIVLSIPPKIAIADAVHHFKGASAFAINHVQGSDGQFKWQVGYGALTISESLLETVARYAARQKDHHKNRIILDLYERIDEAE